jgi:hypothetical protein
MNSFNRALILISFILIFYALYKYQQRLFESESSTKKKKKMISCSDDYDNISQLSLGSLADLRDNDSLFEDASYTDLSLDTNDSLFF